ncbi:MAG: hypothetical protein AB1333_03805 [Patescibacteria group bacterium]
MNKENKICQNCKIEFIIEPEDFQFYKKINVPPPTFCPDCRRQRRMFFRNERVLYKRPCNAPGHTEEIVSTFSPDKKITVYDEKYWWSDAWDPIDYGTPYDFLVPFFEQYKQLLRRIPLIALSVTNMVNCSYCNVSEGDKNCLFISASEKNENVFYSNRVVQSKDSMDLYIGNYSELCYELVAATNCYKVLFSQNCSQCSDSAFLYNCTNCNNCFGCVNLKNKSYYFFNEPYTKEEYEKKISDFDFRKLSDVKRVEEKYHELLHRSIRKYANILKSTEVTGDNIAYAKNCRDSFDIVGNPSVEDGRFLNWGGAGIKDVWDSGPGVGISLERAYEVTDTGIQVADGYFTSVVYGSYDIHYSINCHGSKHLFGCYGLRGKEYCILNKQYTKEEYEILTSKIIQHMKDSPYVDTKGRVYAYGEFFPSELSPYAYNEVIAQEYFPLSKDGAIAQGYIWKDADEKKHIPTMTFENIPDDISGVKDSIVNEIISCGHGGKCVGQCVTAFKILPQELEFYRRMKLPLPRLCPNCRHEERLKKRNPMKLWKQKCQCAGKTSENGIYKNTTTHQHGDGPCLDQFETSYAPERQEIIYCENCYQSEVV